jgi:hypothetical protein
MEPELPNKGNLVLKYRMSISLKANLVIHKTYNKIKSNEFTGEYDEIIGRRAPKFYQMDHISEAQRRVSCEYNTWSLELSVKRIKTNSRKMFETSAANE